MLQFIRDRLEDNICHEGDDITRGEVLTGLLVVFFVETAKQLFEYRAHSVVVQPGNLIPPTILFGIGAQVQRGGKVLAQQSCQDFCSGRAIVIILATYIHQFGECHIVEVKAGENLLHIGGKTAQILHEIGLQLLQRRRTSQIRHSIGGRVIITAPGHAAKQLFKRIPGELLSGLALSHSHHGGLGRFQHGIQTAQYRHGQNHIAVFTAYKTVTKHIIGNTPDVRNNSVVIEVRHIKNVWLF